MARRVVTALTAQNTKGVFAIHDVPAEFIAAQIDAVFADLDVGAVKIGMLGSAGAIERSPRRSIAIVRAMSCSIRSWSRARASDCCDEDALRRFARPDRARDVHHAQSAGSGGAARVPPARDEAEMRAQAEKLLALGAGAVLIKGGHGSGPESVDLLVEPPAPRGWPRRASRRKNTHGTGCTLASAIAAGLAKGLAARRGGAARPRPMSPPPSPRRTGSRSAPAAARCIIFMPGGDEGDGTLAFEPVKTLLRSPRIFGAFASTGVCTAKRQHKE